MPKKPPTPPAPTPAKSAPAQTRKRVNPRDLEHILPDLRALAIPVDEVSLDPRNARQHGDRSIAEIGKSLQQFGQRKPIVVNRATRIVIAGNGTVQACIQNGFRYVAAVQVDDDPATATGYAIADNRTAEFSTWDNAQLATLLSELEDQGIASIDLGFTVDDIDALTQSALDDAGYGHKEEEAPDQLSSIREKWEVVVECKDEQDQINFVTHIRDLGRRCRVLNS